MRALVVAPHEKRVRLMERSGPRQPHGGEVLLRTLEVGICGTDREICAFDTARLHRARPISSWATRLWPR